MSSRTYSARELLRFRHVPLSEDLSDRLAARAEEDFDLAEIIRASSAKPRSLIVEGGSGSEPDDRDRVCRGPAQQLDGTDSVRGRTGSEHERGPITAPSDLAAQRAEGFQKFYNAVISPTHVRVTAGGRIVPNTRGSHSPSVKWARERNPADTGAHGRVVSGFPAEGIPYPILPPTWGHYAPMVPAHAPGFAPGMAFRPDGFPAMAPPMAYNMPGAYAMQPLPYNPFAVPNPPPQPQQSSSAPQVNKQNAANGPDQSKSIPLAPAEQFDPNRPFFYNGQWLMAHGNHLVPYGMMPQLGFAPPTIPNQPAPRPSADASLAHNASPRKPEQSPDRQSQVSLPWTLDTVSSVVAPVSSIRPSSITMKQLGVLRSQKKYHEDQIQYNKHQIDHKDMEQRLQHICSEIEHFQKMYENQLEFEERTYPKIVIGHSGSSSGYAPSDAESESPAAARNGLPSAMKGHGTRDRTKIRSVATHNPSKSTTAIAPVKAPIRSSSGDQETQRKPSSLPVNAALAPPFQPRAEKNYSSLMTAVPGPAAPAASLKPEHLARSASQWRSYFKKPEVVKDYGTPYLTGKLAPGVQLENAKDTDYFYNRELTEDEHRARHMYWGKAPHHLQKGLPKYDGKHFYPPSPVKGNSTDTVESAVSEHNPIKNIQESKPLTPKPFEREPIHATDQAGPSAIRTRIDEVTRSESLHRAENSLRGSSVSELPRSESYLSQPSPRYLEFRRIVNEKTRIASEKQRAKVEDDSGDEDGNLLFKGRRMMGRAVSTKHPNDIWSTMRRKGKTSADVVAGKVSPMTAQGVLPHYAGHASASLSPAIANTSVNPRGAKHGETSGMPSANTAMEKQGENRPPLELLEQQLRSASFQDKNFRGFPTR
ncbi:hypothetical protein ACJ41O_011611 [Fusarium nematophilum]